MLVNARVTTAPTDSIVSLSDIKQHLRLHDSDEDTYLQGLLDAASEYIRVRTERSYVSTGYTAVLDSLPASGNIYLSYPPVISAAIAYYDTDNASQVFTDFTLRHESDVCAWLEVDHDTTWPSTYDRADAVTITWTAGYTTQPKLAQHAVRLLAGHWYENREAVGSVGQSIAHALDSLLGTLQTGRVAQ